MDTLTTLPLRKRTATSAFVVSAWVIPGGHLYDQAFTVNGFFEAGEEDEAKALVARHGIPEMPILMTIAQHDKAVAQTLHGLEQRRAIYKDHMDSHGLARLDRDIERLKAENLMQEVA